MKRMMVMSLFDRLIDFEPHKQVERQSKRYGTLPDRHESIRYHLEQLLNTRLIFPSAHSRSDLLSRSLLNYGIPDYSQRYFSEVAARKIFCQEIENIILMYEPRVKNVKLYPAAIESPARLLRVRIVCEIIANPSPIPAAFESNLNLATYQAAVISEGA